MTYIICINFFWLRPQHAHYIITMYFIFNWASPKIRKWASPKIRKWACPKIRKWCIKFFQVRILTFARMAYRRDRVLQISELGESAERGRPVL